MAGNSEKISFSQLALSLANDYSSIYVIDTKDDSYVEYVSDKEKTSLSIVSSGEDFYADVKVNCPKYVWPDDQEYFLSMFRKEKVIDALKNNNSFFINYRLNIDGAPQYYCLKTIRGFDDTIIIGVQNVDEQKRHEYEAESYSQIANALASRYEVIYYINTETNAYTQYASSEQYARLGTTKSGDDFFTEAASDITKYLHKDDIPRMLYEIDKEHLLRHLAQSGSITFNYKQMLGQQYQYVSMIVVRPKNDNTHIVIGVLNTDAQTRRVQSITAENKTFREIAMTLAQKYEVIYHVNIETNQYTEYNADEKYAKLQPGTSGNDFFADTEKNLKHEIFPEDYPKMAVAMKKENLLASLSETGKNVLNYRLIVDGRPQYASLMAVRPRVESKNLIIAVANIDSAKRMEMKYEEALDNALDIAHTDALTGAKNKRSYVQTETYIDKDITNSCARLFAIVVFDINGLKNVNDTQGHNAGDKYIQDAYSMITDTFRNSTIYRIGGDEFVAILTEDDYENRFALMDKFEEAQKVNLKEGKVTLAYGISDYSPYADLKVQDVFERADNLMYLNKAQYKKITRKDLLVPESTTGETDYDKNFAILFQNLISAMNDLNNINVRLIEELLIKISILLRLSKAVTRVYRNPEAEAKDSGETLKCFDLGIPDELIMVRRVVTSIMSVATISIYMSPDEPPLTEDEKWKVDLVARTIINFVSKNRMSSLVTELTYYDDNGYKNLRSFQHQLQRCITDGSIKGKTAFRYNLRHFTLVNQEFGRKTGDIVMKNHYNTLTGIIGQRGILCRLGGDNFMGYCDNTVLGNVLTYLTEATVLYDRNDGKCINIASTVGVYTISATERIPALGEIFEKIITAFSAAQSGGKDRVVFYNKSLVVNKEKSMRVQQMFPDALKNEEFKVFYQPKVNIETGELVGAEALCRWFHDGAIIPPIEFIPMLEETNDICQLDFYMLDHVCRDINRWISEGRKSIRVSVNLSRKHMMNVNLLQTLLKIIDRHNIPHSCIEIELTETTTDVEFNDLKRVVRGLQKVGIYTSVDDFGIGYSSLNLIRELPWNVIKVDRSFLPVENEEKEEINSIMFKYVVAMAKELGIEVIVEGVETEYQLNILKNNNCDLAQGYFFDRPLPVNEFESKMDKPYPVI